VGGIEAAYHHEEGEISIIVTIILISRGIVVRVGRERVVMVSEEDEYKVSFKTSTILQLAGTFVSYAPFRHLLS